MYLTPLMMASRQYNYYIHYWYKQAFQYNMQCVLRWSATVSRSPVYNQVNAITDFISEEQSDCIALWFATLARLELRNYVTLWLGFDVCGRARLALVIVLLLGLSTARPFRAVLLSMQPA